MEVKSPQKGPLWSPVTVEFTAEEAQLLDAFIGPTSTHGRSKVFEGLHGGNDVFGDLYDAIQSGRNY